MEDTAEAKYTRDSALAEVHAQFSSGKTPWGTERDEVYSQPPQWQAQQKGAFLDLRQGILIVYYLADSLSLSPESI